METNGTFNLVFYGPDGSGKSTQASMLSQELGIPHILSGDLTRKYAKEDKGIIGEICRDALNKGIYVADSEMYVMWKQRLKEPDVQSGWILDGFPRNLSQAQFLKSKVEKYGKEIAAVFYIEVSEEESIRRLLKRGRKSPDGSLHDSPERIKERLKYYKKGKKSVLKYYLERKILYQINGERPIEAIQKKIRAIVAKLHHKV